MSLTRVGGSGLLDRNEGNGSWPFNTTEWSSPTGWQEFGLNSNQDIGFQSTGNHAPNWTVRSIADQSEMMVYAKITCDNVVQAGLGVLVSNNVAGSQDGIEGSIRAPSSSGTRQLRRWDAGVATTIDSTASRTATNPVRMTLWANATDAYLYDHNNGEFESGSIPSPKTGKPGLFIDYSATGQFVTLNTLFFVFTGRYITVTSLSAGMVVRLRDGSGVTLVEETASGSTVTLDCITVEDWDDIGDLRVLSSGGVVLAEESGEVWPGETWDYAASAGAPDTPTISATGLGPHSAETIGSAYSHPDNTPMKGINWQASTDAGFVGDLIDIELEWDDPDLIPDPPLYLWDLEIDGTDWHFRVRYKAVNDVYSSFSSEDDITLDADDPLTTPSIPTANATPTTVALSGSTYADPSFEPDRAHEASQWQVDESGGDYSTPVADSLEDLDNLTSIVMGGLTAGTNYIARVRYRADDGTWSSYSANKSFSTPSTPTDRPQEPVIDEPVSDLTATSFRAVVSPYSEPTGSPHKATQWFLLIDNPSNSGFPNFAGGWGSFYLNSSPVTTRTFTGLAQGRTYGLAVRYQAMDGDWSDWSDFVEVDLPNDPLNGKSLRIISPHHGAKSKTTFSIGFAPLVTDTTYEADYAVAEPLGDWTSIFTGVETSPQVWDVSGLSKGWYLIRVRASNESTETDYEYRLVFVDPDDDAFDDSVGTPSWENTYNETDITWTPKSGTSDWRLEGGSGISDAANVIAAKLRTDIGPFRSFDMAGSLVVSSSGGPFPWAWYPEQVWRGLCWGLKDSVIVGVVPYAGIFPLIYSVPISAYGNGDPKTRGTGPLFLELQGWDEYSPGVGGHQFLAVIENIGTHHFIDNFVIGGVSINKYPEYGIRMRVTTISVNETEANRVIRLQVAVYGPGVTPPSTGWHVDMSVTTNIFCAYCGDAGKTITQTRNPYGDFFGMTVDPLVSCSAEAPIEGGDAPEEAEDVGVGLTGSGKVWSVDLPRFHKTGIGYWHRQTRDESRPAVVDTRFTTFVGFGNQVYRVDHEDNVEGYWTSPTLNRKGRINEYTLTRVILRYESASSATPVIEATKNGGATWVAGFKATVTASATTGTQTKRMVQAFNVTGPDVRFRITFPEDEKILVHSARAEVVERGTQQSE